MTRLISTSLFALLFCACPLIAQNSSDSEDSLANKTILERTKFTGLEFRELGPALTSGRISDFAMHPDNEKIYYVSTSSGGMSMKRIPSGKRPEGSSVW